MMPQLIGKKKYLFYILILFFLSTTNNTNLTNNLEVLSKLELIEVKGLNSSLNYKIKNDLDFLIDKNIYKLDSSIIKKKLENYNFIENYEVIKEYPSKIIVKIEKTQMLAKTYKNNDIYFIGSNGKFINYKNLNYNENIPTIFGNFTSKDFINLKKKLNKSNFKFKDIKDIFFYPSGRWDIKTKSNLTIKLPNKNIDKAIDKFNLIIQSNELKEYNIIDLRMSNQIILSNEN